MRSTPSGKGALIAPTGGRFSYSFDQAGRIGWVQNPEVSATTYPYDKSARYAYDAASRRTIKYLANGTRAAFATTRPIRRPKSAIWPCPRRR